MRPASMVCAETQPPCVACRPKSPKTTRLPRVALPFIRLLWLFRCLTRFGIKAIGVHLAIRALVDPDLNAEVSLGNQGLGKSVIDLRAEGAQRHGPGDLLFAAGHFGRAPP